MHQPDQERLPGYLSAPPLAFAHRGGAERGDENTTAAFERAVSMGYRYLETDVHATADGVVVVFHDDDTGRLLGRPGRIRDLRWADLATLRVAGSAVVPRLDEVLAGWPDVRFNVDIKDDPAVDPTVDLVRRSGATDRVLLASFSTRRLVRVRTTFPTVATSLGMREVVRLWFASRVGRGFAVPPSVVAAQVPLRYRRVRVADRRFLAHAHRLGLQVHVWTIDDPGTMGRLLDLGVDGIMTDRIEVLRDVFAARGVWPTTP
ncbi:glycerophosphodiester phosphodiesterase [Virgisporangium aurantiacum]|uniref:Glycerophosphoryl diester phosphodiesterase n=1 Tax=Virgisporangium aurantiacum TaxID=175570 RepID=A0A8J3Z5C3_9ACTN|nr:glycerophosphodiester phosphodiesterase [Virgisporangium aurantiacum]GIJ56613.1 glycerophosphoryl diester phosphodiesterase [Virgisporangium aurantiacum]